MHTLRHTFGSHLVRARADVKTVQALLGHSSAMVTLDVYCHEFDTQKRQAVEAIHLPDAGLVPDSCANVRHRRAEGE